METSNRAGGSNPDGQAPDVRAPDHAPDGHPPDGQAPEDGAPSGPQPEGDADSVESDLDELLSEARRERDEYLELAQRARADFENYRRRAAEDSRAAERRGRATLARGLVGSLDNLERALQAAGIDPESSASGQASDPSSDGANAHDALAHGVALVYRELCSTLESAGVESYDPAGERFDPTVHEAIGTRPGGGESGLVAETVHKGYRLDGQVLRAAGVLVSE